MGVIHFKESWRSLKLPHDLADLLGRAKAIHVAEKREDLLDWALGRESGSSEWSTTARDDLGTYTVEFDVPGKGKIVEADVVKARNGLSVNFPDLSMRRRDPKIGRAHV